MVVGSRPTGQARNAVVVVLVWCLTTAWAAAEPIRLASARGESDGQPPPSAAVDPDRFLLLARSEALRTGRITGVVHDRLEAVGNAAYHVTFVSLLRTLDELLRLYQPYPEAVRALDVTLRETTVLRSVAIGDFVLIDRRDGQPVVLIPRFTRSVDEAIDDYGIVVSRRGWDFGLGPRLEARSATESEWQQARSRPIKSGPWDGAFAGPDSGIVVPGLLALSDMVREAKAVARGERPHRYGSSEPRPDQRAKVVARLARAELHARRLGATSLTALAFTEVATVWKQIDQKRARKILREAAALAWSPNVLDALFEPRLPKEGVVMPRAQVVAMFSVGAAIRDLDPLTASGLRERAEHFVAGMTPDEEIDGLRAMLVMELSERDFAKGLELGRGVRTRRARFFATVALARQAGADAARTTAALSLLEDGVERKAARILAAIKDLDASSAARRRAVVDEAWEASRVVNADHLADVAWVLMGVAALYSDDMAKVERYLGTMMASLWRASLNAPMEVAGFATALAKRKPALAVRLLRDAARVVKADGSADRAAKAMALLAIALGLKSIAPAEAERIVREVDESLAESTADADVTMTRHLPALLSMSARFFLSPAEDELDGVWGARWPAWSAGRRGF